MPDRFRNGDQTIITAGRGAYNWLPGFTLMGVSRLHPVQPLEYAENR